MKTRQVEMAACYDPIYFLVVAYVVMEGIKPTVRSVSG